MNNKLITDNNSNNNNINLTNILLLNFIALGKALYYTDFYHTLMLNDLSFINDNIMSIFLEFLEESKSIHSVEFFKVQNQWKHYWIIYHVKN